VASMYPWLPLKHGLPSACTTTIFALPLAAFHCYYILMNVSSSFCFLCPLSTFTLSTGRIGLSHQVLYTFHICTRLSCNLHIAFVIAPFSFRITAQPSLLTLFSQSHLVPCGGTYLSRFHPTLPIVQCSFQLPANNTWDLCLLFLDLSVLFQGTSRARVRLLC
jgi:hypothetical protein